MISATSREPKYEVLKRFIIDGISAGLYKEDCRIPSEKELMRLFSTSHITARRALADLVGEGKVYRIQGKGSFVASSLPSANETAIVLSQIMSSGEGNDSAIVSMIQGVNAFASAKGMLVHIDFIKQDPLLERECLQKLADEKSTGAILFLSDPEENAGALESLDRAGVPYVLLDRCARSWQTNYVGSNNLAGAYEQVRHLVEMGHTDICFASFSLALNTERERHAGYIEGMMQIAGGKPGCLVSSLDMLVCEIIPRIKKGEFTALAALNDRTAIDIIKCLEQNGISVPRDVSVIGYDDWEPARYAQPALTTIRQDFYQMGYEGARLLTEAIEDRRVRGKSILMPVSLIKRDSTQRRI